MTKRLRDANQADAERNASEPNVPLSGKLRSLEVLRAVAAILVVLFHTQIIVTRLTGQVPFAGMFGAGYRGVDLFFVLSGFIIPFVHADDIGKPGVLPRYLYSRFARIYPAVWVMTGLAVMLYASGYGGAAKLGKLAPATIAESALLLPQHSTPLVNVTWSLTYELFFYAVFAMTILHRGTGIALLLLWQVATLAVAISGADIGVAGYYCHAICLDFSVGLACAWIARETSVITRPRASWLLLSSGTGLFISGMVLDANQAWSGALCAIGSGAIILALVWLESKGLLRVPRYLALLGGASYSIYLVHFSIISLLVSFLSGRNARFDTVLCLTCAAAGVLAGAIFNAILDRPVQQWLRRARLGQRATVDNAAA